MQKIRVQRKQIAFSKQKPTLAVNPNPEFDLVKRIKT